MNPNELGATEMMANIGLSTVLMAAAILTAVRLILVGLGGNPRQARSSPARAARAVADLTESLIVAGVLVFMIIRPFLFQAFFIPSASMEKTLLGHQAGEDPVTHIVYRDTVHDHLFVNKLAYRLGDPGRGDIAVFKAPAEADSQNPAIGLPAVENTLIKRVIGIPGDTIWVHDGAVWLKKGNAAEFVRQHEPYINEPMDDVQPEGAQYATDKPLKLDAGQYFMMGDNRNHSNDSRFWGVLQRQRVIGKAAVIFFPLNRFRFLP
jgi:signal peptidase I